MAQTEWGPYFDDDDEPELRTVSTPRGTFDVPGGYVLTFSEPDHLGRYEPVLTQVAEPTPTKLVDTDDATPIPPAPVVEPEEADEEAGDSFYDE